MAGCGLSCMVGCGSACMAGCGRVERPGWWLGGERAGEPKEGVRAGGDWFAGVWMGAFGGVACKCMLGRLGLDGVCCVVAMSRRKSSATKGLVGRSTE